MNRPHRMDAEGIGGSPPPETRPKGEVTYEEAFSAHPFGNSPVTMSLTGALIE